VGQIVAAALIKVRQYVAQHGNREEYR
jgi:hypothetical protein